MGIRGGMNRLMVVVQVLIFLILLAINLSTKKKIHLITNNKSSSNHHGSNTTASTPPATAAADGIRYLTYSIDLPRIERFIFPSIETWHPRDRPYYVTMLRQYETEYNDMVQRNDTWRQYDKRIEILFIDDCEDGSYLSACCKQQNGMLAYMNKVQQESVLKEEQGDRSSSSNKVTTAVEWLVAADDDNYFRHDFLARALQNDIRSNISDLFVITNGDMELLGKPGYLREKSPYNCSASYQYRWGQVSIYNRPTLDYLKRGLELGGLMDICREFGIYQDVGNAIFHWMYSLPNLWIDIPAFCFRPVRKRNRRNFGCHGVSKTGSDIFPLDMQDLHEFYGASTTRSSSSNISNWGTADQSLSSTPDLKHLLWDKAEPAHGFARTRTYEQYGYPSSWTDIWHRFPLMDCETRKSNEKAAQERV